MKIRSYFIFSLLIFCLSVVGVTGQHKKNTRPTKDEAENKIADKNPLTAAHTPVYFYEFSKPEFVISKIWIEHDENGLGKIIFQKRDFDEQITEPLQLSAKSLEKIKKLWVEINFLETQTSYQSPDKDYAHLGTIKLRMKRGDKERATELNWTDDLNVRALTDEYRKLSNQAVWIFDMNVSRENQPLESTRIMKRIDSYLRRNEISDPQQIKPFLQGVSEDERFPLITRNHATRLIKQIDKTKEEN